MEVHWLQEGHPLSNWQSKESNPGSPQLRFSSPCIPDPCSRPVCPGLPGGHLCMEGFPFLGRDTDSQAFHENRCLMECSGRLLWFTWKLFSEDPMIHLLPASHHTLYCLLLFFPTQGFPGGLVVKNLPVNAGDTGDAGSSPRSGKFLGKRNGNLLQCSCLENPMDRGAWRAIVHESMSPWVHRVRQDWLSKWACTNMLPNVRPVLRCWITYISPLVHLARASSLYPPRSGKFIVHKMGTAPQGWMLRAPSWRTLPEEAQGGQWQLNRKLPVSFCV